MEHPLAMDVEAMRQADDKHGHRDLDDRHDPEGASEGVPRQPACGDSQRPADCDGDQQRHRSLPGNHRPDLPPGHTQRLEQGEFAPAPADQAQYGQGKGQERRGGQAGGERERLAAHLLGVDDRRGPRVGQLVAAARRPVRVGRNDPLHQPGALRPAGTRGQVDGHRRGEDGYRLGRDRPRSALAHGRLQGVLGEHGAAAERHVVGRAHAERGQRHGPGDHHRPRVRRDADPHPIADLPAELAQGHRTQLNLATGRPLRPMYAACETTPGSDEISATGRVVGMPGSFPGTLTKTSLALMKTR